MRAPFADTCILMDMCVCVCVSVWLYILVYFDVCVCVFTSAINHIGGAYRAHKRNHSGPYSSRTRMLLKRRCRSRISLSPCVCVCCSVYRYMYIHVYIQSLHLSTLILKYYSVCLGSPRSLARARAKKYVRGCVRVARDSCERFSRVRMHVYACRVSKRAREKDREGELKGR